MFKILVLKNFYNLSDDQLELQIRDRLSFRDFLGLTFAERVPDSKTIWGLSAQLFKRFDEELHKQGVLVKSGIIADGTFVDVPKQNFSQDDYAQIKKGETPSSRTDNPAVKAQTDFDARYTQAVLKFTKLITETQQREAVTRGRSLLPYRRRYTRERITKNIMVIKIMSGRIQIRK
jgi:IS5 family transposase